MMHFNTAIRTLAGTMILALACGGAAAIAADVPASSGELSKTQSRQLQLLSERVDKRIKAGLAGSEKEAEAMRSELMQIRAMKDSPGKAKAVADYQSRHADFYSTLMARSGVDLVAVAQEMQKIVPDMVFTATPNGTIVGRILEPAPAPTPAKTPPPQSPPAESPPKTIVLSHLVSRGSTSCGAISGGSNRFTDSSVESRSNATLAGSCVSSGDLTATLNADQARYATLTVRFGSDEALSTFSVVGSSSARTRGLVRLGADVLYATAHSVWAPFLWAESVQYSTANREVRSPVSVTGRPVLSIETASFSDAALGADTRAKVGLLNINTTLQLYD